MPLVGIGIDYEQERVISRQGVRFFLAPCERKWLEKDPKRIQHLLRLWTIKEAIYKANPQNENTILADYILEDPEEWSGKATWAKGGYEFRYDSTRMRSGFLSTAIAFTSERERR